MNMEFLLLANVMLVTRLCLLFRDEPAAGRGWMTKAAIELVALAALYRFSAGWVWGAVVIAATNVAGWCLDHRAGRRSLVRLLLGIAGMVLWSLCASRSSGLELQPALFRMLERVMAFSAFGSLVAGLFSASTQLLLFGLLLSANEANLAIRAVFDVLDLKPRVPLDEAKIDFGEFNRGRVIGVLERALLYVFLLQQQYGAIGFVLAAKAFTRFKALENRSFAEYVLIGTLLSASLVLAIVWLLRALPLVRISPS